MVLGNAIRKSGLKKEYEDSYKEIDLVCCYSGRSYIKLKVAAERLGMTPAMFNE